MLAVGPGVAWPVASGGAVLVTALLAWLLQNRAGLLGLAFPVGYLVVCMLAASAVHAGSVAVPALTPPLVAFLGVVVAAVAGGALTSTTLFVLSVFAPLAGLFWWMLVATVACLVIAWMRYREAYPGWSPMRAREAS